MPDDACVRDETKLCECWVRLSNGQLCPLANETPDVIDASPVLSFQCPKCNMVMIRTPENTYSCITKDCVLHSVQWKPETWEMKRVK